MCLLEDKLGMQMQCVVHGQDHPQQADIGQPDFSSGLQHPIRVNSWADGCTQAGTVLW